MPCAHFASFRNILLLAAILLAAAPLLRAQDASADKPAAAKANGAGKADTATSDSAEPPLREQTIYVPYDKLRETFEKTGRGVFIPYERFQELWKSARAEQRKGPDVAPPTPAVITQIESEATVGAQVVRVAARLEIDVLARGWVEVPLRLADAGVISATLISADGAEQPARLAVATDGSYKLMLENKTKQTMHVSLKLEYAKAFNKAPGRNDVSFAAPQAPINRWKVRIPERGVKIHIDPLIAATQSLSAEELSKAELETGNAEQPKKPDEDKAKPDGDKDAQRPDEKQAQDKPAHDETVLLAFVGAAPTVRIDWTAKAEGASGLSALASVEAQQIVRVEEAVMRTHATLAYSISRAELAHLTIEVPADQKVVSVAAPNVRGWTVEAAGEQQKIVVDLFEPARESEKIEVDLEQYLEQAAAGAAKAAAAPKEDEPAKDNKEGKDEKDAKGDAGEKKDADAKAKADAKPAGNDDGAAAVRAEEFKPRSVTVPIVRALDVARQQGIVLVDVAEGLQVEARTREGLLQLDPADLPANLANAHHELSYRYAVLPARLVLDLTKIKPNVAATELVLVDLEPQRLWLQLQAVYTIERAGLFELAIDIPAGFDVRDVRGEALAGAQPVQVDSHHLEGEDKTRLVVNLSHKALGKVALLVALEKRLDDPNLLGPTGKTSELPLSIPRTAPESIERTDGRLVIYAPESLRVNVGQTSGLRNVSLAEALAGLQPATNLPPSADQAGRRAVSSLVFTKAPVELTLQVERRKPQVTVAQLLVARVDPGVVKYEATFFYDIRYSGVKQLRIDLPAPLAADVRNATTGIAEKQIDPAPDDLAKGDVAWSFSGERELLGAVTIRLTWERRLEGLEAAADRAHGGKVEIELPHLVPRDVDRAWGQVVLVKSETIDLSAAGTPTGLRPIDPQHDLMPGASVPDAALAFEFHDAWSLDVTAARYQLEAVKHTSIERGLVRAVVTRGGPIAVQALYHLRSARQRLAVTLPAGVQFDTDPLRIAGRPTPLERGAKDEFFVPLAGRAAAEPFLLELRYTLPAGQTAVELPVFADEPAVQRVFVVVFLPQERDLLDYHGPWTDEQPWIYGSPLRFVCAPRYSDSELVRWVQEGVPVATSAADTFPVDGQAFIFSALRPEGGPAGSLRLTTISHKWLNFFIFALVLAIGLSVLRQPLARRLAALVALVIALVLLGIFLPMTAVHVISSGLWLALALVVLIWCGIGLYRLQQAGPASARRPGWPQFAYPQAGAWPATPEPTAPPESAPSTPAPPPGESPPNEPPAGGAAEGGQPHE